MIRQSQISLPLAPTKIRILRWPFYFLLAISPHGLPRKRSGFTIIIPIFSFLAQLLFSVNPSCWLSLLVRSSGIERDKGYQLLRKCMFVILKGSTCCEHSRCSFHELTYKCFFAENLSMENNFLATSSIWLEVKYEIQTFSTNPFFIC